MKKRGSKTAGDLSASKLPQGVVKSFSVKESDLYHTGEISSRPQKVKSWTHPEVLQVESQLD